MKLIVWLQKMIVPLNLIRMPNLDEMGWKNMSDRKLESESAYYCNTYYIKSVLRTNIKL